jgi:hypothetical protein
MQQCHKEPLHLRKGRKTTNSIRGQSRRQQLQNKKKFSKLYKKTIGLEIARRIA